MTQTLSILIAAALVNNLALIQLVGVSSVFYGTRRMSQAIEFALFNFIVLFLASVINSFLYRFVLQALGLEFLRLVIFVISGAVLASFLLNIVQVKFPFTARAQKTLLFLTGGNSAVLGASLLGIASTLSLPESILYSFGAAGGFCLVLVAIAAMRERLEAADIPSPFRGNAILLITTGIATMSLLGFAGLT